MTFQSGSPGLVPLFAEGEHYNDIPCGPARRAVPSGRRSAGRASDH